MESKCYSIKDNPKGFSFCPLCDSELSGCYLGMFCSKKECPYVDGIAWLTPAEAERFKDLIARQ